MRKVAARTRMICSNRSVVNIRLKVAMKLLRKRFGSCSLSRESWQAAPFTPVLLRATRQFRGRPFAEAGGLLNLGRQLGPLRQQILRGEAASRKDQTFASEIIFIRRSSIAGLAIGPTPGVAMTLSHISLTE